ncbi:MAG: class I SAM-dependent methyltransferase [Burkholderiales bacterium]|nr:class I SAM-dependent methyltransferase [Burkholderiales bacterium]
MKYYDRNRRCVIQTGHSATAKFWDEKWQDEQIGLYNLESVRPFVDLTAAYLPAGASILEGGCGAAGKVAALVDAGYAVTGIDFAENTVRRINRVRPDFEVQVGNVFALPFHESSFDGYWSFGVIEHFWGGYDMLLREAWRVLKTGGYLFLTYPSMSPLRRFKAKCRVYRTLPAFQHEPADFYQFLLDDKDVLTKLTACNFQVERISRIQSASGIKQELALVWKVSQILNIAMPNRLVERVESGTDSLLAGVVGHLSIVAARKTW